ncbi:MAG: MBL fold metallo-hydrolase [Ruminococcaceae bacterium]|nr:MBL fold metallo-hydrolase [Oscillospiraceae bacterium]
MKKRRNHSFLAVLLALLLLSLFSCEASTPAPVAPSTDETPSLQETPAEQTESVESVFSIGRRSTLSTYQNKSAEDFTQACTAFEEQGYILYAAREIGGNLFKTYTKADALAHLCYHPALRELTVALSDREGSTLPPPSPAQTEAVCESLVTQLEQKENGGNGMGYVIRLSDGSFLIYDGGYAEGADEILQILKEQSPTEIPLVRAWIITHFHSDHCTAFHEMARRAKEAPPFTLEYVLAAPPVQKSYESLLSVFSADLASFPEARYVYPHTGMTFSFSDLTLEILYSPESLWKKTPILENFNDSSIVSRLQGESGSLLITGDVAREGAALIETLYGNALKSDMVQMSHHGLEDCPLSFYEKVRPTVLWIPCGASSYHSLRNRAVRQAVEALPCVKETLVAGNGRATRPF